MILFVDQSNKAHPASIPSFAHIPITKYGEVKKIDGALDTDTSLVHNLHAPETKKLNPFTNIFNVVPPDSVEGEFLKKLTPVELPTQVPNLKMMYAIVPNELMEQDRDKVLALISSISNNKDLRTHVNNYFKSMGYKGLSKASAPLGFVSESEMQGFLIRGEPNIDGSQRNFDVYHLGGRVSATDELTEFLNSQDGPSVNPYSDTFEFLDARTKLDAQGKITQVISGFSEFDTENDDFAKALNEMRERFPGHFVIDESNLQHPASAVRARAEANEEESYNPGDFVTDEIADTTNPATVYGLNRLPLGVYNEKLTHLGVNGRGHIPQDSLSLAGSRTIFPVNAARVFDPEVHSSLQEAAE